MRIVLTDIGKQYGKHWILKHVNAEFKTGQVQPIIGNNGSGKSTLLQIISGYITPNEGTVTYERQSENLEVESWFQHISIAAPYLDLFEEFTVLESVEMHRKLKPLQLSDEDLLSEIDLWDHRNKTLQKLSSGMRQRLKLALAIYSKSDVLLLDEPCSNLDQRWSEWFNVALSKTIKERITLICSNNQKTELEQATETPLDVSADHLHE